MIIKDQPSCFDESRVQVVVSSASDGQIQYGWDEPSSEVLQNITNILSTQAIAPEEMTLLKVKYHQQAQYDVIKTVDGSHRGYGLTTDQIDPVDCLITTTPRVALFLPIADCVGTVVYDPINNVLALAHLGRHSSIAKLAKKLVQNLQANYESEPSGLIVWMAPSIQLSYYVLEHAEFIKGDPDWEGFYKKTSEGYSVDLQNYNKQLLLGQGVLAENIHVSAVNTATNPEYWSHFTETTVNAKEAPPRFAVVAMLK